MNVEWTHKGVLITDIRKVKKFYVLTLADKKISNPLFVDHSIFEGRVNSYYLRGFTNPGRNLDKNDLTRDEVLSVKWNMVINKGYYIKYDATGKEDKIYKDEDKFYISFLEIDGPLGMHISKNS